MAEYETTASPQAATPSASTPTNAKIPAQRFNGTAEPGISCIYIYLKSATKPFNVLPSVYTSSHYRICR